MFQVKFPEARRESWRMVMINWECLASGYALTSRKGLMGRDWTSSTAILLVSGTVVLSKHWSFEHLRWWLMDSNCSDEKDQSLTLAHSNLKVQHHTSSHPISIEVW